MTACFDGNIEATELLLRIVLDREDLKVKKVTTQKAMKNLQGRDIYLDIDAVDSNGSEIDIEIQRANQGADRKRARYHSSIMDAHLLKPGDDFKSLPETYVIFITEKDIIGQDRPLYAFERQDIRTGEPFNDGTHIVYVNGSKRNARTKLGKLMHDFFCTDPNKMYYKLLAERAKYFKEEEKGARYMGSVMDEIRKEAVDATKIEAAKNILKSGKMSVEEIAEVLSLPIEEVEALLNQKTA